MNAHIAEYVSPGHPDRLADAIVESIVTLAVKRDPDALVGVECAVHTDHVFIDGRIAAGRADSPKAAACAVSSDEIEALARRVYRDAGYGADWMPAPENLKVIQNVCLEPLSDDERAIRDLSDDQNVVVGYACNSPATDDLPPAHFVANFLGRKLWAWRQTVSDTFGPDFKVLVDLVHSEPRRDGAVRASVFHPSCDRLRGSLRAGDMCHRVSHNYEWHRLTISIQHRAGVFAAEQHERVLPVVRAALAELERRGLVGIADLPLERFVLNGMGDFIVGGPEGDNGLSGKKLAVDFYGPEISLGGGAICGKDPHKVDVAGAFRARELAVRLLKEQGGTAVTVRLGWTPGDAAPAYRAAERVDSLGISRPIPASALPAEDWFSIRSIVSDLRLTEIDRVSRMRDGYLREPQPRKNNAPTCGKQKNCVSFTP